MALPTTSKEKVKTFTYQSVSRDCNGPLPGNGQVNTITVEKSVFIPLTLEKKQSGGSLFAWRNLAYQIESAKGSGLSRSWANCSVFNGAAYVDQKILTSEIHHGIYPLNAWDNWFYSLDWRDPDINLTSKLYRKVSDATISFNLGVTLGEGKETITYLIGAGTRLVNAARYIRRGQLKTALRVLRWDGFTPRLPPRKVAKSRTFSQNLLEVNFAITPIINDAYDFAHYAAFRVLNDDSRWSTRFSVTDSQQFRRTIPQSPGWNILFYAQKVARWTFVCKRTERSAFERKMAELKLDRLASTLWEVAPLSFVVDAFVNIGDVLDSLEEFRAWQVSKSIGSERVMWIRDEVGSSSSPTFFSQYLASNRRTHFGRQTGIPWPTSVVLKTKVPSNPGQWLSFLALLRVSMRDEPLS